MDRLLILDPQDLTLRFEVGKKSVGMVQLTNVMHTMPVAYKIQSTAPKKYSFKPPYAIIPPLGKLTVEIMMNPQNDLPESYPQCHDKFTVKSVVVPGGYSSDQVVSVDWFTAKRKAVFSDTRLKVYLVGGGILRDLISRGAIEEIREVLDHDSSVVDATDENGFTAMHVAVQMKRPELVQVLLEYKANLEIQSKAGQTPLQLAAQAGEALITEVLLAKGAKTEATNQSGWTALHYATVKGHCEVMKLLIEGDADIDAHIRDGRTAIHLAVAEGHKHCVNLLLEKHCNVDASGADGGTALHMASARGHVALVKLLLERGANKDVRNSKGRTPYDDAADSGQTLMFDMLLLGDNLRHAARKGELKAVKKCLKQGAVVDGEDQYGWTALQRAAFKGRLDIVKFLIEKGADLKHKDEDGYTALHIAVEAGQKEVVHLLVKKGSYVNEKTKKGLSPLQLATAMNYVGIVRILLEGGASRDASFDPERWRSAEVTRENSKVSSAGSFGERFNSDSKVSSTGSFGERYSAVQAYVEKLTKPVAVQHAINSYPDKYLSGAPPMSNYRTYTTYA